MRRIRPSACFTRRRRVKARRRYQWGHMRTSFILFCAAKGEPSQQHVSQRLPAFVATLMYVERSC